MFQKIAKHCANDASNDVHRPPLPLPHGQHMAIFCFKTAAALVGLVSTNSQVKNFVWCLPYSFTERFKSRSEHMWPPELRQWEEWALPLSPPRQLAVEVGELIETSKWRIREDINRKKKVFFRALPEWGWGGGPCPNWRKTSQELRTLSRSVCDC